MPKQSAVNNDEHGTVPFLVWKMQPKKKKGDEPTRMVAAEPEPVGKNQALTASATPDIIANASIRTDSSISHS